MENTVKPKKSLINTGRQVELDYAKALAIVFMIFVHCFEACKNLVNAYSGVGDYVRWIVCCLGCAPAAPMFMLIMGIGIVYARRSTPAKLLKRAGMIFGIGLFVNVFSEWLYSIYCLEPSESFADYLPTILATDIYSFVALMMLVFTLIKATKHECLTAGAIMAVCLVLNELTYPNSFTTGNDWLDMIAGMFVRVNEYSYFPFVTWAFWPLLGFLLGNILIRAKSRTKFYTWVLVSGIAALAVGGYFLYVNPGDIVNGVAGFRVPDDGAYYAMNTPNILWAYGIVAVELFILHIVAKLAKDRIPGLMKYMSLAIMPIYVIQWIIISAIVPLELMVSDIYVSLALCAAVTVATVALAWLLGKLTAKKKNEEKPVDPADASAKPIE